MKAHPIIDYPYRWIPILLLLLVLVAAQVALVCLYTGADYLPALVDGIATMGWLAALAYLAWYVVGFVSLLQTDIIMIVVGALPAGVCSCFAGSSGRSRCTASWLCTGIVAYISALEPGIDLG